MAEDPTLTDWLNRWFENREVPGGVFDLVYDKLREIASRQLADGRRDPIVQTTVVVNEAYLKLAKLQGTRWNDREHFFAYSARVMRHVLVDLAKERLRQKRGAGAVHVALDAVAVPVDAPAGEEVLAVHQALAELEAFDPERARIVELRYFGGMEPREIGRVLGLSESTIHRRWRVARAWLYSYLAGEADERPGR